MKPRVLKSGTPEFKRFLVEILARRGGDGSRVDAVVSAIIADVRQRFYRGYCMHNQYVVAAAREMRAQHPQIIGVLGQVPGLEPATQQRAGAYLEKFFADIGTDADVGSKVLNRCLG